VPGIGTGLGDDVDYGAGVAAVFGIEGIRQDTEFVNAIGVGLDSRKVGEEVVGIATIHAEVVGTAAAAVD
jgi:hypothetical protein